MLTINDQAAFGFVISQGRNLETEIYSKRYPSFDYALHIPIVTEGNQWAIGTQFRLKDHTGKAKFISGAAKDMPFGKSTRDLKSHDFAMLGAGWEWSDEEVAQAQLYGIPLQSDDAMDAANDVERELYDIFMEGAEEKGWKGFVNSDIVQKADAAATGTGSSTFWADKDVDKVLADINGGIATVKRNSKEVEFVSAVRLPPAAYDDLAVRRMGAGDGAMTVLDYVKQKNTYTSETGLPLDIRPLRNLATASPDGGGRAVFYRRDKQVVRGHLPMPRQVLTPYRASLMGYQQGVIARTGGTEIRLPGAVHYLDEITDAPD